MLSWGQWVKAMPSVGKSTAYMLREGEEGLTGHLRDIGPFITQDILG